MSKINLMCVGSSGFVFGNVIRYLIKNFSEYKISSIDSIKNPNAINSIYYNGRHNFYIADIIDKNILDRIFEIEKPNIVIHGADIKNSSSDDLINTNILGTQNLIDLSIKHKVNKFIYSSTDKVYGSHNENDPLYTEESPINPQNLYTSTKCSAELLLKSASMYGDLKYNIIRSCNIYGPRQDKESLIPKIIKNIFESKPIYLYNKGLELRSWLHVQDFAAALKAIMGKGLDNEIYNVGGAEFTNIEVFNEICNVAGKGNDLLHFIPNEWSLNKFRYATDGSKLKNLGWKSEFKFKGVDGGLNHTYNFLNNNRWLLK